MAALTRLFVLLIVLFEIYQIKTMEESNDFQMSDETKDPLTLKFDCLVQPIVSSERLGIRDPKYRWPNATVFYTFDKEYPEYLKRLFHQAILYVSSKTCLKFAPWTDEPDYVFIYSGVGCNAAAGRIGGKQPMSLPPECGAFGIFVHEVLHSIGMRHEHQRPDRDVYVNILWGNIKPEFVFAFRTFKTADVTTLGLPYDFMSIMHYSRTAFTKNNMSTIIPKEPGVEIGVAPEMSVLDIKKVNRLYEC